MNNTKNTFRVPLKSSPPFPEYSSDSLLIEKLAYKYQRILVLAHGR